MPVLGAGGRLDYLIHWLDDVTDLVGRAGEQDWTVPPPGGAGARTVAALLARTRELQEANRAMELANEALHDAYDAKKEFVDRLSHELRTPLNTMLGFGELLSMDDVSARHREWITMTLQAGRQLVQLLDEVGDAARIEARTLSLSLGAVRLDTVIADVLDLVRPLAMSCGVRLAAAPAADGTAFVRADEQRLRQVLLNLLDNAVKYNHPALDSILDEAPAPAAEAAMAWRSMPPSRPASKPGPGRQPGAPWSGAECGGSPRRSTCSRSSSTSSGTWPPAVQSAQRIPTKLPIPVYMYAITSGSYCASTSPASCAWRTPRA